MPTPLHVPRVNNNDDTVSIVNLAVREGDFVKRGQVVGAVETDKAVVDIEAESDGYVLKIFGRQGETANVGSVLLWLGESADEAAPERAPAVTALTGASGTGRPTAKARAMLTELGIAAGEVPAAGDRLTVADIEKWLTAQGRPTQSSRPTVEHTADVTPDVAGAYQDLSPEAHGMMTTVQWHRDHAAPAYLEMEYDPAPWEKYAARYAAENKLMLPPLMPLMAFRLVDFAKATPHVNAAIVNNRRYQYAPINLGFTVQVGQTLYLTVVHGAQEMDTAGFIDAMGEVQRRAMTHKLRPSELSGTTVAFSSMARWNVSRHIPILPPHTGLIVAHAAPRGSGRAVLGASYDHRLLSGFDVIQVLQALAQPPV